MTADYFISKVYRQHNSMVIVLPHPVCVAIGIKKGNHVIFTWRQSEGDFEFTKYKPVGAKDVGDSRDSDRKDKGG